VKFNYRYIVYKIYSWTAKKKGETPIGNTVLTLGAVHFFQLATLLLFIDNIITPLKWMYNIKKPYLLIGALIYFILVYFLIYDKKRWGSYIQEFGNESARERKRGNLFVVAFLAGSILLFFISLPVLFSFKRT